VSDKKLFVILLVILALSIALLLWAVTNVGHNFTQQF
jgi:hypothetical protein